MTEQEALRIVDHLVTAIQKFRSTVAETSLQAESEELFPHLLGEHNFLKVLLRIQDRGTLTHLDFYNVLAMADLHPEIDLMYFNVTNKSLPELDSYLGPQEWDGEEA